MIPTRSLAIFAAVNGALAVMIGAFAAHGAEPAAKALLTTGAQYQMVHALLALACGLWGARLAVVAGWLASVGGFVFCLSLVLVARLDLPVMGAVAPIGGVLMIAGWLLLIFAALRSRTVNA